MIKTHIKRKRTLMLDAQLYIAGINCVYRIKTGKGKREETAQKNRTIDYPSYVPDRHMHEF